MVPPQEHPEAAVRVHQQRSDLRQPGLRVAQVLPRRIEGACIGQPAVIAGLGQGLPLLKDFHDFAGQPPLVAQVDDLQVGAHGFGQHSYAGSQVVRLRSLPLGGGGTRVVAIAAPEVEFVGDVKTQVVGRQADPVGNLEAKIAVYVGTHPQFVQVRGNTRIGRCLHVGDTKRRLKQRKRRGFDDTLPRPGLVDPGNRLGEVEVRGQHRFDNLVENRVGERLPPLQRLV